MNHLHNLPVLVLGLGASGLAMARWCARNGAQVTVADTRSAPPQLAALQRELPQVRVLMGAFDAALVQGQDIRAVYCSPGLAPETLAPVLGAARAQGLVVGGELDLFARALQDLAAQPQTPDTLEPAAASEELDLKTPTPCEASETGQAQLQEQEQEQGEDAAKAANQELAQPPLSQSTKPGYHPQVLAITGTNGKTTVTSLTGQLVARAGKSVAVAGNIGPSLLDTLASHLDAGSLPEVWVLELSSFQLEGVQGFEPTAATVLNLTQDHLDWHGDMAAYGAAKARIFGQQALMLLNRDDPQVLAMLPAPTKARLQKPTVRAHQCFGADMPTRAGDWGLELVNGMTWLVRAMEADETRKRRRGELEEIHIQRLMPADALRIRGRHNACNALAALALATAAGCSLAPMLYGLREYRGEPHRVEPIGMLHGVEYFDDSKGTNVGATLAALQGLGVERRLVLILGGDGKGQDFSPLGAAVVQFVRAVVLIGRDAGQLRHALQDCGVPLHDAPSMEGAVALAASLAQGGDAVLLSPACASLDMFDNYAHRAQVFRTAVEGLAEQAGCVLEGGL